MGKIYTILGRIRFVEYLFIVSVLSGCALSQEGAIDYRKSTHSPPQEQAKVERGDEKTSTGPDQSKKLAEPMRLLNKFILGDDRSVILKGDSISIRLGQAFIANFWELGLFSPHRGFRANGEIAIIVNAFEFSPDDKSRDIDFTPEGLKKGRLVFFSDDVEEGQFLNMANMPIYGPITYNGNPVGIAISIIEIDANTNQISALLGTLASIGGVAYPPAAPVLPILDSLGQALLNSGTDDTEFRFTFILDPKSSYNGLSYPRVEAANYVFVRENDRRAVTPWDKLTFDENSGRLYSHLPSADGTTQGGMDKKTEYRENTYLTIQVNKGFDSADIDLAQDTFISFRAALDEIDEQKAENLKAVAGELETLIYRRVQKKNFLKYRELLNEYTTACDEKENKKGEASRAGFDLYMVLNRSIEKITSTKTGTSSDRNNAELSEQDIELILGRLRERADAQTEEDLRKFTIKGFRNGFATFDPFFVKTCPD